MNQKNAWDKYSRRLLERSFNILIPLLAILAAFVVSSVLIILRGVNPLAAYSALFSGAFGSLNAQATTLTRLTPLVFTGLAVAYGYRGGFFNIGAEGQLYIGAMATAWVGVALTGLPGLLVIPILMVVAGLAGALWALIPGYLKASRGFNEVVTTLLMNYIAIQLFNWVIRLDYPVGLKDASQPFPKSGWITESAWFPTISSILNSSVVKGLLETRWAAYEAVAKIPAFKRFTLAAIMALLAAFVIYVILFKSTTGFRSRAVGVNPDAAEYMGINVSRTIITTAMISGSLAGLAGAMEVMGSQHRVIENFLIGAGFDGIPVALIGQLHPLGVLLSALFFGALRAGANKMQIISGVPVAVIYVIQSLAILFAIAGTTIKVKPRVGEENKVECKT